MKRLFLCALLTLVLVPMQGCRRQYHVWIGSTSTTGLEFGLGTQPGGGDHEALGFFAIDSVNCERPGFDWGNNRMWGFSAYTGDKTILSVSKVRYGAVPLGFIEDVPPRALSGGCFAAHASAERGYSGYVYFRVDAQGRVQEIRTDARGA
jgi:hypothetical protein